MTDLPEKHKRPGVLYAFTGDGVELPVVDVTNPAFRLEIQADEIGRFTDEQTRSMTNWSRAPGFLRSGFARGSVLMGGRPGGVVDGLTTYLYKLGPDNLGAAYTKRMDKKVAQNIMALAIRMRLEEMSRLLALELKAALLAHPGSVHLLNLAGGSSMDSLNAVILVNRESPELLRGRTITVDVLDPDPKGFAFGRSAAAALIQERGPLHGLDLQFSRSNYDWADASSLAGALDSIPAGPAAACRETAFVASSEGGLFEYASDEQIVRNLEVLRLRAPGCAALVVSALRDEPITGLMKQTSGTAFIPREPADLERLAESAGWRTRAMEGINPVYRVFTCTCA